jgi:hypothetical protein
MARGETVEKMQVVVKSLAINPAVVVVGGFEHSPVSRQRRSPQAVGGSSRILDIFAHPREPIYDPEGLNDFMFGLVTVTPTRLDYFHLIAKGFEQHKERLALGRLCFDETVANTALSDMALTRCTTLRVFPDAGHLLDAANGHNQHDIPTDELGQRIGAHMLADLSLATNPHHLSV